MQPLVSIIIPARNAGKYLAETLTSALAQTWQHTELIVVDDASTDDTAKIIESFGHALIKVSLPQNRGAAAARNAGLAVAKGAYIQFLDADDLLSNDKIESQLKVLNASVDTVSHCRTAHFTDGTNHLLASVDNSWAYADFNDPIDFLIKLYAGEDTLPGYGGMINPHAWLTPKTLIDKAGPWNETLTVDDDGEFFNRVVLASKGILFSPGGVTYYRKFTHGGSLSGQKHLEAIQSTIAATNLKYQQLKAQSGNPIIDRIFARHYWWTGTLAYPQFKTLSKQCIAKATKLGYSGERYTGGPLGHALARVFGWRAARYVAYYRDRFNKKDSAQ